MASGILPVTAIPGWPSPVAGVMENFTAPNGGPGIFSPDGLHVSDVALATNYLNSYVGSSSELTFYKNAKQAELDTFFYAYMDFDNFIITGTITTVTAAQVGNFIAQITNNYRSLRSQISNAATVAAVNAININSGWPNNP